MKTTLTLVSCFAALLMATSAIAQTGNSSERYVRPRGEPHMVPTLLSNPQGPVFTITEADTNWQNVSDGQTHPYTVIVRNISSSPQTIYFSRYQNVHGCWTSSVCWGINCYPATVDSMPFTIAPDSTANLILDLTAGTSDNSDSASVWLRVGVVGSSADTILLPFYGTYFPANPPIIFSWSGTPTFYKTYQGPGTYILFNFLQNLACDQVKYSLSLDDSLPSDWSLAFHDTRQPYSSDNNLMDTTATGNSLVTNFSAAYDTTYQQKLKFILTAPNVTQEDSAVIYLSVHPKTNNPADSAIYRFVMDITPTSGVTNSTDERAGIAVTNAWPNPLVSHGTLHVQILTDANGPAKAVVYDVTGTQKAILDLGTLSAGTNDIQLPPPTLPSGEYMFRVVQDGSTSEVVKINFVK